MTDLKKVTEAELQEMERVLRSLRYVSAVTPEVLEEIITELPKKPITFRGSKRELRDPDKRWVICYAGHRRLFSPDFRNPFSVVDEKPYCSICAIYGLD